MIRYINVAVVQILPSAEEWPGRGGRPHTTGIERAEAVRLWDEGNLSAREVAESPGMSYYVVRRALSEAGRDPWKPPHTAGEKHHSWAGGGTGPRRAPLETVDPSDPMACNYGGGGRRPAVMQHRLVI